MNKNSRFSWQGINKMKCDAANGFSSPKYMLTVFKCRRWVSGHFRNWKHNPHVKYLHSTPDKRTLVISSDLPDPHTALNWPSTDVHWKLFLGSGRALVIGELGVGARVYIRSYCWEPLVKIFRIAKISEKWLSIGVRPHFSPKISSKWLRMAWNGF